MRTRSVPALLVPAIALVLAACGGGTSGAPGGTAGTGEPSPVSGPASPAPASAPASPTGGGRYGDEASPAASPGAGTVTLSLADTDLGSILVDGDGRTLYLFTPDTGGTSTCYDDCATSWPPLLADGAPATGDGVDAALLGSTSRTDGTTQVTYNGWPLYFFAGDTGPGETNGQGLGGKWYVLDAAGEMIR